jgi:hypothetical protein
MFLKELIRKLIMLFGTFYHKAKHFYIYKPFKKKVKDWKNLKQFRTEKIVWQFNLN